MDKDLGQGQMIRRPAFAGLTFLSAPASDWHAAFELDPEELEQLLLRLGMINARLPHAEAVAADRAAQRRKVYRAQGAVLREYAGTLRSFPDVGYAPEPLLLEASRISRFESAHAKASQALNAALDLRLVLGGLQWFLLQQVLAAVVARMEHPDCPRAERERLQSRFSRLLLRREALQQTREQRKAARDKRKKEAAAQLNEVESQILIEDTMEALRQGREVDPTVLERAARAYRDQNTRRKNDEGRATKR
jgi:hypothetical protein